MDFTYFYKVSFCDPENSCIVNRRYYLQDTVFRLRDRRNQKRTGAPANLGNARFSNLRSFTNHYPSLNKHRKVRSSEQLRQRHRSKSFIIGFERKKRDTYTLKLRKHLLLVAALFLALNKVINTAFNRTNRRQGVPFSLCKSFSFQNTLNTRLSFIASQLHEYNRQAFFGEQ